MQFVRIHRRFPYTALSPIGAHCVPMGLNPYREIVFRSIFQIAGARTVNRLFSPFSDVRKKKGLRIFRRLFHADAQNWFFVVLLRGLLFRGGLFLCFRYVDCLCLLRGQDNDLSLVNGVGVHKTVGVALEDGLVLHQTGICRYLRR